MEPPLKKTSIAKNNSCSIVSGAQHGSTTALFCSAWLGVKNEGASKLVIDVSCCTVVELPGEASERRSGCGAASKQNTSGGT